MPAYVGGIWDIKVLEADFGGRKARYRQMIWHKRRRVGTITEEAQLNLHKNKVKLPSNSLVEIRLNKKVKYRKIFEIFKFMTGLIL